MIRPPPTSTLFPYTTLFRSSSVVTIGSSAKGLCRRIPRNSALRMGRNTPFSSTWKSDTPRSEEHTSELQSQSNLVCRLLLEKKKKKKKQINTKIRNKEKTI